MLEKAGYATVQATDGEEAVRLLKERGEEVSLALLDVVMPKMSGRDVYRYIRQACPHVRTAFCTGYDRSAQQTGFIGEDEEVALVEKPFSSEALLRTVRDLLDDSRAVAPPAAELSGQEAACIACES